MSSARSNMRAQSGWVTGVWRGSPKSGTSAALATTAARTNGFTLPHIPPPPVPKSKTGATRTRDSKPLRGPRSARPTLGLGGPRRPLFGRVLANALDRTAGLWTISDRRAGRGAGTAVACSVDREVAVEAGGSATQFIAFFLGLAITAGILVPILLRLRGTVGEARAEKAGAGRQVSQLKRTNAALEEDLQVPHPVPEGFPAPGARALQRAHRAPGPGGAAEHRAAQPRPAARRGAGAPRRRQGRQGQAAPAGGGRGLPRGRRDYGGHRDPARSRRDRVRRRGPDGGEPAGPAGRDGGEPHQAGPGSAGAAGAGADRAARLRPGHARRDRALEAAQERRPEGGAAARDPDRRPGAAHGGTGEPHEDDRGDGRAHAHLQQEAPGADAERAHLPRRVRRLRPALGRARAPRARCCRCSCSTSTTSRTTTTRTATWRATSCCRSSRAS